MTMMTNYRMNSNLMSNRFGCLSVARSRGSLVDVCCWTLKCGKSSCYARSLVCCLAPHILVMSYVDYYRRWTLRLTPNVIHYPYVYEPMVAYHATNDADYEPLCMVQVLICNLRLRLVLQNHVCQLTHLDFQYLHRSWHI